MKNLGRSLRLALRQRWTFAGIIACSVAVAVLWGANIGAVYPFVEVIFQNKSMQDWAEDRIETSEKSRAEMEADIAQLQQQQTGELSPDEQRSLANRIAYLRTRIDAEDKVIETTQRIQPYIDRYLPDSAFQTLILIVVFLMAATLVKNLFLMANMILVQRFSDRTVLKLRNQLFEHTLAMELGTFNKDRTGDLMSRVTGNIGKIGSSISFIVGKAMREPMKASVCLIGAATVSWKLLLFSFITAPLAIFLTYTLAKSIKRANRRQMEESSRLLSRLLQSFHGIQAVKAYTMEKHENERFQQTTQEAYRKGMKITFYQALTKLSDEVMGICVVSISILAGGYLVLNQETHLLGIEMTSRPLSFGAIMLFFAFLVGASDPLRKMSDFVNVIQAGAAAGDRVYPFLDRKSAIVDPENPQPLADARCPIVFDNISFHYEPEQPVLKNVSLRIPFGQKIAIVGANGCGKTTLANLIPRFYDPVEGDVRLGYVNIRDVRLHDLRRRIGVISQQTVLFDDTVMDNIRYGSPEATDEQVIAAAKQAHAHNFIMRNLENGYESHVGEQGKLLSGGQRQRLALARAILRDPDILIMDEATSQIDPESEQLIHNALEQFIQNRTTIMITHRMSSLSLAERIVVMNDGEIVDDGTHDELSQRCDLYRRLYQISFKESA